jgi:hypothetical protein
MTGERRRRPADESGQSTVELALLLPAVVVVLLLVVQVGLLARDRVLTVHAARSAARAVAVEPTPQAARRAIEELDGDLRVSLGGELRAGGMASVTVTGRPTALPLVGHVLAGVELRERLVVLVEGP